MLIGSCFTKSTREIKSFKQISKKHRKLHTKYSTPVTTNKNVQLALNVFDETTTAAIRSYFPEREDAASFLSLFHKLFVVFNSKQRLHSYHYLLFHFCDHCTHQLSSNQYSQGNEIKIENPDDDTSG